MKFDPYLTPFTKFNLKWIKDLILRLNTIKLLGKKKKREKQLDTGLDNDSLDMIPKEVMTKEKINETIKQKLLHCKRQLKWLANYRMGEDTCKQCIRKQNPYAKFIKIIQLINNNKTIKNLAEELNRHFFPRKTYR